MAPRAGQWLALLIPLSAVVTAAEEESLFGCRKIEVESERLACYDRAVDRTREELAQDDEATIARNPSPEADSAPPSTGDDADAVLRERLFGRTAGENERTLRKTFGLDAADSISAKAVAVSRDAKRLLELTLENGQIWRQRDALTFVAHPGDTIQIKAGALGAYYMQRNGKGRMIRVTRVR